MAFYITPPSGTISLQRLMQFANTRFTFLCKILETNGNRVQLLDVVKGTEAVKDSECLIEGTCKDKISHAILRLACCEDPDMSNFLLMAETLLFDFRFSCMTKEELCKVFRSADRYRKHTSEPLTNHLRVLSDIRNQCSGWREVVRKYLDGVGYFCTPYQNVLKLVARREVALDRGLAFVPFNRLREVVTEVFKKVLDHGLKFARSKVCLEDERIVELVKVLKVLFRRKFRGGRLQPSIPYGMLHTEVDQAAEHFPPCMAHLHRVLRKKHRLNHHARNLMRGFLQDLNCFKIYHEFSTEDYQVERVQYTLFLKEAGLPVHEALIFWRLEYCQPVLGAGSSGGCQHVWAANERRYTYSIRHLYGLEGSRINYRGHSCAALQENYHGVLQEGGCPFSHFDREHLDELLAEEGMAGDSGEVLSHVASGRPSAACTALHNVKLKSHLQGSSRKAKASLGNCINSCRTCPEVCKEFGKGNGNQVFSDIENIVPENSFENSSEFEQICNCQDTSDNIRASTCITQSENEKVLQDVNSNHKLLLSCFSGGVLRNSKIKHSSCDQNSSHSVGSLSGTLDGDSHSVSDCQSKSVKDMTLLKNEGQYNLHAQCSKDASAYDIHRHLHPNCTEAISSSNNRDSVDRRECEMEDGNEHHGGDTSKRKTSLESMDCDNSHTEPIGHFTLQAQSRKDASAYESHRHLHPHCAVPRTCSKYLNNRDSVDRSECKMEDEIDRNEHHHGDDTCQRQTSLESIDWDTSHTEAQCCNHVIDPISKPVDFFMSYTKLLKKLQACQS